jgi:hypothetical protein
MCEFVMPALGAGADGGGAEWWGWLLPHLAASGRTGRADGGRPGDPGALPAGGRGVPVVRVVVGAGAQPVLAAAGGCSGGGGRW